MSISACLAVLAVGAVVFSDQEARKAESNDKGRGVSASDTARAGQDIEGIGAGLAALDHAAKLGKYTFIFFYRSDDEPTQRMRKVFDTALGKLAERAEPVAVRVTNPAEKPIVSKFKVGNAPMPFVFSVAPNGAVVRGYRKAFTEQQLAGAFASPGLEKVLKSLQDGKMTFLSVQNGSTKFDAEAMRGVSEFRSDPKYAKTTEVVMIDPSDAAEAQFLKNLKVDPHTPEAVTVLLAPPGKIVGTFKGATNKSTLVATVRKAASGCGSGCGPKGCKPRKKTKSV